ncbi:MAG: molybdenum cofactor biosynthesis protein [Candidatus Tectomicrobia bacterium RIFCSPLOWO2_12_FULL_69_37]|nr:MAG: molybdenum cofactor biosynthesis protein [Candidatus Tectomicrobia bacterium RIFCSPLOWO2_12_FULL_69_37]
MNPQPGGPSREEVSAAAAKRTFEEHRAEGPGTVTCAVITVSDTRTEATDTSGRLIQNLLADGGHRVAFYRIVKDEPDQIRAAIEAACAERGVQVVITNGGTGITARDTTYDVVASMIEKEMPGFGELFRFVSYQDIGTAAMLTRATAGTFRDSIIMTLPGSGNACRTGMEKIILPEISHMVREVLKK